MSNVVILCARMSSTRLPGKALSIIEGKTTLQHLVERFRTCRRVDRLVVATSIDASDDPIERVCAALHVDLFRGSLDNVVRRMNAALMHHSPDAEFIFRGLGDMLLFDQDLLDWRFDLLARRGADVVWCGLADDPWPVYGSRESPWSRAAWDAIVQSSAGDELEHPGQWLYHNLHSFRVLYTEGLSEDYYRPYRLELDTEEDLACFRAIFKALHSGPGTPRTLDALRWLDEHPEVARLNIAVEEKTLTDVSWKRRGVAWVCAECGAQPLRTDVIKRGKLMTECPRCGAQRPFVEVPAFLAKKRGK